MEGGILLTAGLILAGGAAGGALARRLRLPTLTGYLAAGILIGPQALDLLPHAHLEGLAGPVNDLAMALVLFVLGGQFHFRDIRPHLGRVLRISTSEGLLSFLLVLGCTWPLLGGVQGALLLGVMAVAVAPATTLLVLEEYHAEGPTSTALKLATALSNLWSVLFFEVVLLVLLAFSGQGGADAGPIAWDVGGSLLFGLLAGHVLILLQDRFGHGSYSLPLLTVLALTIGSCRATGVPHMLTFLVTGAVVVNRSRFFAPITASMEVYAQPAFVAFFVLSGLHIDFHLLAANLPAVGAYVLARSVGKVVGARLGMGRHRPGNPAPSALLGSGLLCQAGAAIALAQVAREYDPALGDQLLNIVLGAVVVFELLGPLLVKRLVVAAGEVRLGSLLVHGVEEREHESLRALLLRTLRGPRRAESAELRGLRAEQIMRTGIRPLPARARMDEILHYANAVPFNQFPVVDGEGRLIGLLRLRELDDLAYDPAAAGLVIAADLVTVDAQEGSVAADWGLDALGDAFQGHRGNLLAVVDGDGHFLGALERAEFLRLLHRAHREENARAERGT